MKPVYKTTYKPSSFQLIQLTLLSQIVGLAEIAHIKLSIFGGYGLDGLVGVLTRQHDDIDILVSDKDRPKLVTILEQFGFFYHSEPPGKEVFKNETFDKDFKIEVLHGVRLAEFIQVGSEEIFPSTPNAYLEGYSFTVPTLKGNEFIQEKEAARALRENWEAPYRHAEHRAKLIEFLKSTL